MDYDFGCKWAKKNGVMRERVDKRPVRKRGWTNTAVIGVLEKSFKTHNTIMRA
jgi:hypothetical protein